VTSAPKLLASNVRDGSDKQRSARQAEGAMKGEMRDKGGQMVTARPGSPPESAGDSSQPAWVGSDVQTRPAGHRFVDVFLNARQMPSSGRSSWTT
jgi:hypothetical protein